MQQRVFEHRGKEYTLTAYGPEETLAAALSAVETLIRTNAYPLAGTLEFDRCVVRLTWEPAV